MNTFTTSSGMTPKQQSTYDTSSVSRLPPVEQETFQLPTTKVYAEVSLTGCTKAEATDTERFHRLHHLPSILSCCSSKYLPESGRLDL
ncbi:hypothetical protein QQF64_033355 [Cirrhinus molitorella]|uniref:Uncharacterized protein n=1 Tax=Cirrhinus molitorella TaxID=172907 RepID=A0ABR3MTL8_9TELE